MADKFTLLIVEDDIDIADMLNAYFRVQDYHVVTVNWGEDAIRACQNNLPDLIILDIRLPDIDGFDVARRLRSNRRTQEIPIIFLTERRERQDRMRGLEMKAEDYITKPFDIQELRLRVRNALRRTSQNSLTNPVTGLAEGNLVDERLRECLDQKDWVILTVTLANLDYFREVYGFVASDDLLRATALMIQDIMHETGSPNDFLGHLTGSSFILVVEPDTAVEIRDRTRKRLGIALDYFYRDQDRDSGVFKEKSLAFQIDELSGADMAFDNIEQLRAYLTKLLKGA